jgi:hypothetical protein
VNGHAHFAWLAAILLLTVLLSDVSVAGADPVAAPAEALRRQAPIATVSDPLRATYYIVRFTQYVHWPLESDFPHWSICVPKALGVSTRDYAGQTTRSKSFAVREVADPTQLSGCHILDLTLLDVQAARRFIEQAQGQPILTVGNGNAFCSVGGIICLEGKSSHLSFEINLSATRRAGLFINARLLSLGKESMAASGSP